MEISVFGHHADMKIKNLFLSLLMLVSASAYSQILNFSLQGKITDTLNRPLANASITLLQAKDSILLDNVSSNSEGVFAFPKLDSGKYIVLIAAMGYQDGSMPVAMGGSDVDMGHVKLYPMEHLLKEVVVRADGSPMKQKGDTTEYNTRYFKTQKNASVENLLKKLPGVEVSNTGKIKAQGQEVKRILVDGDEFFGDDPTLVTKNLNADMVSKVQIYDAKSKKADFTGVDDGQREKTINLKIKEDKKRGLFGSAEAGKGTDGYYVGKATLNSFKNKRKLAAFVQTGNTMNSISNRDSQNLGFGNGGNSTAGQGLPTNFTGGIHYDNKWQNDQHGLNGNYIYDDLQWKGRSRTVVQNTQSDRLLNSLSEATFSQHSLSHRADVDYQWKPDSTHQWGIKSQYHAQNSHNQTDGYTQNRSNQELLNSGNTHTSSQGNADDWNMDLNWGYHFRKKGRSLFISFQHQQSADAHKSNLYTQNNGYQNQQISSTQLTDQQKDSRTQGNLDGLDVLYTEPLSPSTSLIAHIARDWQQDGQRLFSYNKGNDGQYSLLDSLYSGDFIFRRESQTGGVSLNYTKGKLHFDVGTDVSLLHYVQKDKLFTSLSERNFINWNPKSSLKYNFSAYHFLTLTYTGKAIQPELTALQPLRNNNDPFNIFVGNSALNPSFNQEIKLSYLKFGVVSGMFLGANATFNNSYNAITTNINTTADGINTYSYANIAGNGNYTFTAHIDFGKKFSKPDVTIAPFTNYQRTQFINFVNGRQNSTTSSTSNIGLYFAYAIKGKLDVFFRPSATYNQNTYSLAPYLQNNYWSMNNEFTADAHLLKRVELNTSLTHIYTQKTQNFPQNFNQTVWNAWLGYRFLKAESLLLKISCLDILNQNKGFKRTANNNLLTENTYATIQRYLMLSLTWQFKKFGTSKN